MIRINAYHQPGVEAGKKAASEILLVRKAVQKLLLSNKRVPQTAFEVTEALEKPDKFVWVYKILESLVANDRDTFDRIGKNDPWKDQFFAK